MRRSTFCFLVLFCIVCLVSCQQNSNAKIITDEKVEVANDITLYEFEKAKINNDIYTRDSSIHTSNDIILVMNDHDTIYYFRDNKGVPYDEDRKKYKYIGYLQKIGKNVIQINEYENLYYILLDKNTYQIDTIAGIPYLSPNGKYIFCQQYNPYESYEEYEPPTSDSYLYKITGNKIKLVYKMVFDWIIEDSYWNDDLNIYLKGKDKNDNKVILKRLFIKN